MTLLYKLQREQRVFFYISHDFPRHILGFFFNPQRGIACFPSRNTLYNGDSTTWLEFKDMPQDSLVSRNPVSASCNRRQDEVLETQKYSLCTKEHPANCSLRWKISNGLGCISHDCKLDLVTIQGNLTGDQYIREVLQPVVVPHFDNHPLATRPVYMDDNARPHRSRAVTAYLQSEAVTSVP